MDLGRSTKGTRASPYDLESLVLESLCTVLVIDSGEEQGIKPQLQ